MNAPILPTIKRKRENKVAMPGQASKQMTPEEWQEDQNNKQKQHAANLRRQREEELENYNRVQRIRAERGRQSPFGKDVLSDVDDVQPAPTVEERVGKIIPSRGPKTDGGSTIISEDDIPLAKRVKRTTKVEAARAKKATKRNRGGPFRD